MSKIIAPESLKGLANTPGMAYWEEMKRIQAEVAETGPQVGMPATFGIGSDSYATEVIAVTASGKTVTTTKGVFTLRKGGRYVSKGQNYGSLTLGVAIDHLDPHF